MNNNQTFTHTTIKVVFCDKSTHVKEYEDSVIAQMHAMQELRTTQGMGENSQSIVEPKPHVIRIRFEPMGASDPEISTYVCRCGVSARAVADVAV